MEKRLYNKITKKKKKKKNHKKEFIERFKNFTLKLQLCHDLHNPLNC